MSGDGLKLRAQRAQGLVSAAPNRLKWHLSAPAGRPPSMLFFTMHKAASSLVASTMLPNARGLRHVDYSDALYKGNSGLEVRFQERGYLYGPLRATAPPGFPERDLLVREAVRLSILPRFRCTVLVRDPRDVLVSAYYSFGFTHSSSPDEGTSRAQQRDRTQIQARSIDEFVLERSVNLGRALNMLRAVIAIGAEVRVLRFEDLVHDFDTFAAGLDNWLDLPGSTLRRLEGRARPRNGERTDSHKRSGVWGDFRSKLQAETVALLDRRFEAALAEFGYDNMVPEPS